MVRQLLQKVPMQIEAAGVSVAGMQTCAVERVQRKNTSGLSRMRAETPRDDERCTRPKLMYRNNVRSTMFRWVLGAGMLGTCLLGYVEISTTLHDYPHYLDPFMAGKGPAPEQYRVLVLHLAYWLTAHVPGLVLYRSISLISTLGLLFAGFSLFRLLERTPTFQKASAALQWLGSATFVLLMLFYLQWVGWYYRPDTLPNAASLAAMYWLWALPPEQVATGARRALVASGLLLLAILQGFMRADIAVAMNLGVFLATLLGLRGLSLPRWWALAVSALGILLPAGILLYLMHFVYPQASYGSTEKFMLPLNIKRWWQTAPFLLFVLPVLWTAVQGWKRRKELDAASLAVLAGGMIFMAMWLTMGKDDEVRIYAGFAIALAPLSSQLVIREAQQSITAATRGT